jgi:hypothetical protein
LIHLIKGKLPKINTSDGSCLDFEFIKWSLASTTTSSTKERRIINLLINCERLGTNKLNWSIMWRNRASDVLI